MVWGTQGTDSLDKDEPGEASTGGSGEILVEAAWIDAVAPLSEGVINVPRRTLPTKAVDSVVISFAGALPGCDVQYLVDPASVAFETWA